MHKTRKKADKRKIATRVIAFVIAVGMILTTVATTFADESKVLTLGANLSDEQKQLILDYLSVAEEDVDVITVTNEDEHKYLDGVATQQQIGTRTFSCSYIEPTQDAGIHIKTVNIEWATCEMIRNALITSGITSCNIICLSPISVSGTGALTGIFKAYSTVTGEELEDSRVEVASTELVTTMNLAEDIGQDEASSMVSELKEEVIVNNITEEDEITSKIDEYLTENNIELTQEQRDGLISLMKSISEQEYDIEDIKKAYEDVTDKAKELKEAAEEGMGFFEKIFNFFKNLWRKIVGTYDKIQKSEEYEYIEEQLGILTQTNDSLLGDDTVVTVTEDNKVLEEIEDKNKEKEDTEDTEDTEDKEDTDRSSKSTFETDAAEQLEVTGDSVETTEQSLEVTDDTTSSNSIVSGESNQVLELVDYETQNGTSESGNTLDDLCK